MRREVDTFGEIYFYLYVRSGCTVIRLHHPALTLAGAAGLSKRQQQLFDATQLRRLNVKAERKQRTPASIGKGIGLLTPTL